MTLRTTLPLAFAAVSIGLAVLPSRAAEPAIADAIATRQAGYKKMGAAMKELRSQLKTDAPDAAAMTLAATTIATTAAGQGRLFPAGSGPESGIKTDALQVIWTDRATFDGMMATMTSAATALVATTQGHDLAAIGAAAKTLGDSCGACHKQFRAPE